MNPLFNQLQPQNNMLSALNSLKSNPVQFLMQRKFNVPQGMSDPNAIIQHLLNTGQVSQAQYSHAQKMLTQFNSR